MNEMMDVRVTFCDKRTAVNAPRTGGCNTDLEALFKSNSNRWLTVHDRMFSKENALGRSARCRNVSVKDHGRYKRSAFISLVTPGCLRGQFHLILLSFKTF